MESSKTRGDGDGRRAMAIVCTIVPPATAKWSTHVHKKLERKCDYERGRWRKWNHEVR